VVERKEDVILLRDSKNGGRTLLKLTPEEWSSFVRDVKAFDDPTASQQVLVGPLSFANVLLQVSRDATIDDESQGRVLRFWRFVRATWLLFAGVAIGGASFVGAAVAGGAVLCGIQPHTALGLGACGGATVLITATVGTGHFILSLVRPSGRGRRSNSAGA